MVGVFWVRTLNYSHEYLLAASWWRSGECSNILFNSKRFWCEVGGGVRIHQEVVCVVRQETSQQNVRSLQRRFVSENWLTRRWWGSWWCKLTQWQVGPVINTFSATQTWREHNLCKLDLLLQVQILKIARRKCLVWATAQFLKLLNTFVCQFMACRPYNIWLLLELWLLALGCE